MKRKAILLVLITALCVLFCGCVKATVVYDPKPAPTASPSGARLTKAEYEKQLKNSLTEKYTKNLTAAALLMATNGSEKASQIKKYAAEGNEMLDVMEQGLTEVWAMNPPQEIEYLHQKLLNSLKLEWEWVQLHRALFSSKNNADVKQMNKEFELWRAKCDAAAEHNETYMSAYMEILKKLK